MSSELGRYRSAFRWPEFGISAVASVFRWPEFDFSYLTAAWTSLSFQWFDSSSVIENVVWTLITVFESIALTALLCYFFVFCGCTL